ncbi:MAG: hypothetical protein ACFFER_07550 [Candidatus Thorarchaeota archaeon]
MRSLSTITPKQFCTMWWGTRWIRTLVLLLIPVGIIDAAFTLLVTWQLGWEIEFNPITQFFLSTGLWPVWALMNIGGFALFSMLAGSYYLHTRRDIRGPDSSWLALIIALRVAMAAYNVTYYFIPFYISLYPPIWIGFTTFVLSFIMFDKLLSRTEDFTWRDFKRQVSARINSIRDARLIRAASKDAPLGETTGGTITSQPITPRSKSVWLKRGAYLFGAAAAIVLMTMVIEFVGTASGLIAAREQFGAYYVFTDYSGRWFLVSLCTILFFIGLSMYMIIRAFDVEA